MANYSTEYKKYIESEIRASKSMLEPGNLYRISSYEYSDGESRSLAGVNSSIIFVFGIYEKKLNCLKLNEVKTDKFKTWLQTILKEGLKPEDVDSMKTLDEIIITTDRAGNRLFESKIKGKPIYTNDPRPYRTYTLDGLKYIQEIKLKKDFIKSLL
jgi:hypothetical protein